MEVISNTEFGGERPLFESHNLRLETVSYTHLTLPTKLEV